jgi:hypothetical protein
MANRRTASGTAITNAPAIIRCSFSTSSAIWNDAPCVPAMFTAPTVGMACGSRSRRDIEARFRADAGFAPEVYEFLEAEGDQICDPAPRQLRLTRQDRLSVDAAGRTAAKRGAATLCQFHLSSRKLDEAAPGRRQGRMAIRVNFVRASASS